MTYFPGAAWKRIGQKGISKTSEKTKGQKASFMY